MLHQLNQRRLAVFLEIQRTLFCKTPQLTFNTRIKFQDRLQLVHLVSLSTTKHKIFHLTLEIIHYCSFVYRFLFQNDMNLLHQEEYRDSLLLNKIVDFLVENATITEVPELAE